MSKNNFTILAATPTPTPTATPSGGMTNLVASLMGQYCFYDILNGKPSYKHKDTESYVYWKQGFWNIGINRNLKGYVAVSSSLNEPPISGWINIVGSVNFAGFPRSQAAPDSLSDLTVVSMSECPAPTPTPTSTPPGFTYPPTRTPTKTPTPTQTTTPTNTETSAPTSTPTETPGASTTPTATEHIPAGYLVSGTPLDIRCCGSMGRGGEVHQMWDGFVNPDVGYNANTLEGAYIMFDDNIQITSQVSPAEGSKIDHYAIEWIEIHQDDSVHAILSERKQICHYPGTNVASSFITIGSPKAAYAATNCKPNVPASCGDCIYSATWCLYRINYIQPLFKTLKYFGGIDWEGMKYIASLTISKNGANGPIGANTSYYNGPYYRSLSPSISGAYSISALDSGNGMNVFSSILANSEILEEYKNSGEFDIKNTIIDRLNLVAAPYNGGSSDPCCSAKDFEFMNGNCPKDPTNDWWIVPDCNCDRFSSDPGYGAGGPFGTEVECYRNTTCGSSFRCLDGKCQETYFGYYPTIVDCIVNCPFPRVTPLPPSPTATSSPPPLKWYFDECSGGQPSCLQGTPPFPFQTIYDSELECESDSSNVDQCTSECGNCQYSYDGSINQWKLYSDSCGAGCSCPSESYVNSHNSSSGGCDGEPTCATCSAPCTPYPGFMFTSESKYIDW